VVRIGLLGCGNIAGIIAAHSEGIIEIVACYDRDEARMEDFSRRTGAVACPDPDSLLAKDYRVLVEAASVQAVSDHLLQILESGKDTVVLSVGALTDEAFLERARERARDRGVTVRVPSGAVFGLDNLKVAQLGGLEKLVLRTTKPPGSLGLEGVTEPQCLFRGAASDAVRQFPRNINISAAMGLAANTEPTVELWADPAAEVNRHEIEAEGDFGKVSIRCDNLPSPDNPATSYLAALSALALLKGLDDPVKVGT
jgi:aspartate dehydrogenase